MAATLKDIAKRTGLSVPSVCLILNGQGHKFRPESRKAVADAALELKYRPDMVMRRMGRASARRDAIGFLVQCEAPTLSDQTAHEYMCGVNDFLLERDQLMVTVKLTPGSNGIGSTGLSSGGKPPRLLSERFVDGLLLVETGLPEELEKLVEHYEIMTVRLNTQRRDEFDCVYPDEENAGRLATEHLLSMGHKRVLFIPPPQLAQEVGTIKRHSAAQREQGYVKTMEAAGLRPEVAELAATASDTMDDLIGRIVSGHASDQPITGVITSSFSTAIKCVEQLNLTPLRCPRDVSFVSAGDLHLYHDGWPMITRVNCDRYTMGRWAAEMLLAKIDAAGRPQPSRIYRGTLVPAATAGPAPVPDHPAAKSRAA